MLLLRFAFFNNILLLRFALLILSYPMRSFVRRVKDDPGVATFRRCSFCSFGEITTIGGHYFRGMITVWSSLLSEPKYIDIFTACFGILLAPIFLELSRNKVIGTDLTG